MVSVLSYFKQVMAFFARYANGNAHRNTGAWREKNCDAIGCETDGSVNFMLELCQLV